MQICVLASGSSGNCTVVRLGGRTILIDAGIGPRAAAKRLDGTGVQVSDLSALLLTHLDSDHFKTTWFPTLERLGITVHLHRRHLHAFHRSDETQARRLHKLGLLTPFDDQPFGLELRDGSAADVHTTPCDHDQDGSTCFRIETVYARLAFATDVGAVSDHLIDALIDVDLLAIESNYDPPMQLASSRPIDLKQRIMGGRGHLSNEQAYNAVCRALERSTRHPRHVVLLHLSRQCNRPALAQKLFAAHQTIAPTLCITHPFQRTDWLTATPRPQPLLGEQLLMW